jgi:hypothetical protein
MNVAGMTTGAALLVARSVLVGEPRLLPQHATTWAAVGYLVVVGSVEPKRRPSIGCHLYALRRADPVHIPISD